MKNLTILFASIIIVFLGCSKPAEKTTDGPITTAAVQNGKCPEFYYFYGQEKVPLAIAPNLLGIGFKGQPTVSQKRETLKQLPGFVRFLNDNDSTAAFNIIELKKNTTCAQALETMKKLQVQEIIAFANPVFLAPGSVGSGHSWAAVNANFIITLKDPKQTAELQKLLTGTNTRQTDDLGNGTYLLEATKNSKGNALEMANYFHGQPIIKSAEPDFFLLGPPENVNPK